MEKNDFWYKNDDNWYYEKSRELKLPKHCPFSTPYLCPRYYQSLKFLKRKKIIIGIDPEIDKKLKKKWKNHPLNPCIAEELLSIRSEGKLRTHSYKTIECNNFCPEVTFNQFGIFARTWIRFTNENELDKKFRHEDLARINADRNDWRWWYSEVNHIHYSDCREYSVLPSIKAKSIKIKLKSVKIKYIDKEAVLEIGNQKCQMPPFKNEHYFCRAMYDEIKAKEPISWDIIHEKMTDDKFPEYDKKNERKVYDAMEALNKRIKKLVNTNDDLFSWQEKTVKRNY